MFGLRRVTRRVPLGEEFLVARPGLVAREADEVAGLTPFLAQNSSVGGSRLIIHSGGCGFCTGCTASSALSVLWFSPWKENGCLSP